MGLFIAHLLTFVLVPLVCGANVLTRGCWLRAEADSVVLQGPPGPPGPSGPPGLKVEPQCLCQTFLLSGLRRFHRRLALSGRSWDAGSAGARRRKGELIQTFA